MSLSRFLKPVVTVTEEDSAQAAARKLGDSRVGCVLVTRGQHPVAILTDRDLALRVVAEGLDAKATRVRDIATYDPIVLAEDDGIETALARIRTHGVRRLPVVDARGVCVGILTADDLVALLGRELGALSEGFEQSADASDSR